MPGNRGSFAGRGLHCCCGRSFGFDNLWPKQFEGGSHWCAGGERREVPPIGSYNPIGRIPRGPALSHHKSPPRRNSPEQFSATIDLCPLFPVVSTDRRNTLSLREKMECDDGSEILSWFHCGRENGVVGALAAGGVAQSDWAGVWQAVIFHLLPSRTARRDSSGSPASLAVGIDARGA